MATKITVTVDFGSVENEREIRKWQRADEVVWLTHRGLPLIPVIFPGTGGALRVDGFQGDPNPISLSVRS